MTRVNVGRVIKGAKLAREFFKYVENLVQILVGMVGHVAGAHDGFAIAHSRIDGRCRENALLEETLGKLESFGFAADEDGNDRGAGGANLEADALEALVHLAGIFPEHLHALGLLLHDLKGLEHAASHGRGQGSGEDEAAGAVLEILDHLRVAGDESPHGTEGL